MQIQVEPQAKLKGKNAVIYGGGGAIGGAVARAFAAEGAHVFLAGRTRAKMDQVARDIEAAGGRADSAVVDALDEAQVTRHADEVSERAGGIDIALNAIGLFHVQGTPLAALALEDYFYPVSVYTRTNFITAKAVAGSMARRGGGLILAVTTPAGRMAGPGYLGHSVACAGVEALTRHLAGELGAQGIRVVCIRSHAIPESVAAGSHADAVFRQSAPPGTQVDELLAEAARSTLLGRLPTLAQIAGSAVFLASSEAGAMTGAMLNLSCGVILD